MGSYAQALQHKQQISDEDRQLKAQDFIEAKHGALAKLPSIKDQYGEDSQQYKDAMQTITQSQYGLGQLYHPDNAPGALQKDWHFLLEKMHGIAKPKDNTPSSTTSQAPEMTLNTPAAPITTSELPGYQQTTPTLDLDANLHTHPGSVKTDVPGVASTTVPGMTAAPPPATPVTITQSFEGKPAPGMVTQGNLDLSKRPNIDNGDGTHSSTFSMSFGTDKGEVLVPGVGDGKTYPARQLRVLYTLPDGSQKWAVPGNQPHNWIAPERPTPQNNEALNQYQKTGKNFGTFEDEKAADAYGKTLHEDQEKYGHNGVTAHPVSRSGNITLPAGPATTITKAPTPSWGQAQVLKQKAAAMQKAQQDAALLVAGSPFSPEEQASVGARAAAAQQEAQISSTLAIAKKLGIELTPEEIKQKLGFKSFALKPIPGAAGQAVLQPDGSYARPMSTSDNTTVWQPMPAGWKPNTKAIAGTVINTKEHGWIKTWLNPYTLKVMGWQPTTPPRGDLGTQSSSDSVDAMGLKTSSSRKNMPVGLEPKDFDFGSVQQLPDEFDGTVQTSPPAPSDGATTPSSSPVASSPTATPPATVAKPVTGGAAPKSTPKTPAQLRSAIPAPPPTEQSTPIASAGKSPGNAYFDSLVNNVMSGKTPPSEIPGGSKVKSMVEARISQLDKNYDPTKADSDFKYANEKSTKDLLNYLTSLTGKNGNGGNLEDLVRKSDRIDRTDFPPLNDRIGWAKLNSGSREIAEYYTTITEVADQVAKILQGGGSGGGTSDAKLRQASELFDKGFTKDQIRGVSDSLKSLLGNRKDAIIGDNYYLNRWYKPKAEHYAYARDPNGKIKRKPVDDQSPLPAGWKMMPQGWTPNATSAATTK